MTEKVTSIMQHRSEKQQRAVSVDQAKKEAIQAIKDSKYFAVFTLPPEGQKTAEENEHSPAQTIPVPTIYRGMHLGYWAPLFCNSLQATVSDIVHWSRDNPNE
jgi:hypothetical protein